jgi:hypothetical protein
MHSLRSTLRVQCPDTHDWASLVMYAALPPDLEQQLLDVRYSQTKRAIDCALERIDKSIDGKGDARQSFETERKILLSRVDEAARYMPTEEGYETEGRGILASTEERKAEMLFRAASKQSTDEEKQDKMKESLEFLQNSLRLYDLAYKENMKEADGIIRKRRSLHWVMTQYLSLRAVLGEPFRPDHWGAAVVSADVDMYSKGGRTDTFSFAHGSKAELYLMLLAYDPDEVKEKVELSSDAVREKAREHTRQLLSFAGNDAFPVYSTKRQFERYIKWWGDKALVEFLKKQNIDRKRSWDEKGGLVDLARELTYLLGGK